MAFSITVKISCDERECTNSLPYDLNLKDIGLDLNNKNLILERVRLSNDCKWQEVEEHDYYSVGVKKYYCSEHHKKVDEFGYLIY